MGAASITLRSATGRDMDAVDTLLSQSYPRLLKADYPPSALVTAVPLISRANAVLVTSGTYYVAEAPDGSLVGAGGWTPTPRVRDAAQVRHLVVHWRHQREGIGRRLMMGIFSEARLQGIRRLEAQSTRNAVRFYSAMGFEGLGEIDVPLRPGIDFTAVLMRRFL